MKTGNRTVPTDFVIAALDVPALADALRLVDEIGDSICFYKVGMELYLNNGPGIIHELKSRNKKVFLDLKLNDIPATIYRTVLRLAELKVDLLTLFCDGPSVEKARQACDETGAVTKLLNITVLTSMSQSDLAASGIDKTVADRVWERANLSAQSGAHGIVCSGADLTELGTKLPGGFLKVTPGIRLASGDSHDQSRVVTPKTAFENGASHIVVGRPIRDFEPPAKGAELIWQDLNS